MIDGVIGGGNGHFLKFWNFLDEDSLELKYSIDYWGTIWKQKKERIYGENISNCEK